MKDVLRVGTLFSGIETPIVAMNWLGIKHEHVFSCEYDRWCRSVISLKFDPLVLFGDINRVDMRAMPDCDLVVAGIPCQSFSHMGHRLGLQDERGNLFLKMAEFLSVKRPKCFVMENVPHLLKHDGGKTFGVMCRHFARLGYATKYQVLESSDYGIPQMRRRIYIVGYVEGDADFDVFQFPEKTPLRYSLDEVLGGKAEREVAFTLRVGGRGSPFGERHNWEYYKVDGKVIRIGVKEACLLQGLPAGFYNKTNIPENEAMKQIGNAMTVDLVGAVVASLVFHGKTVRESCT